jgi:hypothetical protein
MDDLTHGPSAFAIGRIELLLRETLYRISEAGWSLLDVVEKSGSLIVAEWTFKGKLSDGIARVCHADLLGALDHQRANRMRKGRPAL